MGKNIKAKIFLLSMLSNTLFASENIQLNNTELDKLVTDKKFENNQENISYSFRKKFSMFNNRNVLFIESSKKDKNERNIKITNKIFKKLNISGLILNNIVLSKSSELENIEFLFIKDNFGIYNGVQVSDLYLPKLSEFRIYSPKAKFNLSFLNKSKDLKELSIMNTVCSNFNAEKLEKLFLSDNSNLENSKIDEIKDLELFKSKKTEINFLKETKIQNIKILDCNFNRFPNVRLDNLNKVSCLFTKIKDKNYFEHLINKKVNELELAYFIEDNKSQDCNYFDNLKGLKISTFTIAQDITNDLFFLNNLEFENLIFLNLGNSPKIFKFIKGKKLEGFTGANLKEKNILQLNPNKMEKIELINCQLEDFSALQNFKNLVKLNLSGSNIKKIDILKDLPKLKLLNLSNSKVKTIEVFKDNPNIEITCIGTLIKKEDVKGYKCKVIFK